MTSPRRIRLVIADDRPQSRDGLRALLATWPGVEIVAEAANGLEAVNLARDLSPDTVLLDARMPVMDGLAATRILKSERPETRVVILTMYESYRNDARAAGADAFLIKGCSSQELLWAIGDPGSLGRQSS